MPEYKQRVKFYRDFTITAKNAKEANDKLDELINEAEWDAKIEVDERYDFEDEPVECPTCKGNGVVGDDEQECTQCHGECCVPFSDNAEVSDGVRRHSLH